MKNKVYPTKEQLNQQWWYRAGKILKILIIFSAFFSSTYLGGLWYLDGVINAFIWYLSLSGLWFIVKYIIYGKAPNTEEFQKEKRAVNQEIVGAVIIFVVFQIIAWSLVNA